jgi:hypothetical protein
MLWYNTPWVTIAWLSVRPNSCGTLVLAFVVGKCTKHSANLLWDRVLCVMDYAILLFNSDQLLKQFSVLFIPWVKHARTITIQSFLNIDTPAQESFR